MKNQQLALLNRARMSTLNAIRRFGDTDAEPHFQKALDWINRSMKFLREGHGGHEACMSNAIVHLQTASRTLGFEPVVVAL